MENAEIKVIRSRQRRTVSLEVRPDGALVVHAPWFVSSHYLQGIVANNRDWIQKKRQLMDERRAQRPERRFTEGENLLFRGGLFPLRIVDDPVPPLRFDGTAFLLSRRFQPEARERFVRWYRAQALAVLNERVRHFTAAAGLACNRVSLSNARRRWGSCSSKGNLHFSWRLVLAPPTVLDYVVAHEVAHLAELNHSERFWNRLAAIFPDPKPWRAWLRRNGHLLEF